MELSNLLSPRFIPTNNGKIHQMWWPLPLRNIYVVKKNNMLAMDAAELFIEFLTSMYPHCNIIVPSEDVSEYEALSPNDPTKLPLYTGEPKHIALKTDLIVTFGGDGTILRALKLFPHSTVPPVLSFAMGTLGFLIPFDVATARETFSRVYHLHAHGINRRRLECLVNGQRTFAMNDVLIHRGGSSHLTSLEIYIDDEYLTTTKGDGLVISSPTGSTAYSLSAGGLMVHPQVQCTLLTPICPRLLSFRPLIVPSDARVRVVCSALNRELSVQLSVDGMHHIDMQRQDYIDVTGFSGVWCVARTQNDWTRDINELLGFNSLFQEKHR